MARVAKTVAKEAKEAKEETAVALEPPGGTDGGDGGAQSLVVGSLWVCAVQCARVAPVWVVTVR